MSLASDFKKFFRDNKLALTKFALGISQKSPDMVKEAFGPYQVVVNQKYEYSGESDATVRNVYHFENTDKYIEINWAYNSWGDLEEYAYLTVLDVEPVQVVEYKPVRS